MIAYNGSRFDHFLLVNQFMENGMLRDVRFYNNTIFGVHIKNKNVRVWDLCQSWMISSFSMNEQHGLAIGKPKELTVGYQ
jgi:hypothetical protein